MVYRKENDGKRFLVVDAAMNDLIRPALYGAYHEIVPVTQSCAVRRQNPKSRILSVRCVRPEISSRATASCRWLNEGDLLAILDAGAYGMVLASNYNTRPRPAEVLVSGKSVKVIRRREKVSDLLRAEV